MRDFKILLCDDSLLVRKKMSDALSAEGFTELYEAADGEEAVAVCKSVKPDLVLMDIVMPKKDGLEALDEIKKSNSSIHVVMVSSIGTQGKLMQAIKLGADNFLQKPVTVDAIIAIIDKIRSGGGEG